MCNIDNESDSTSKATENNNSETDVMADVPRFLDEIVRREAIKKLARETGLSKNKIGKFYDHCKKRGAKDVEQCVRNRAKAFLAKKKKLRK
ncbi:hypothetical protein [Vibrio fluminensis]|uniref:hypothetical protein n=1 Tax=Vibrio fluminensis TaxID=2783614 RepID=UPI0018893C33|nr:hypothetical protein [Vibrio fluminensis]